MIEFQSISYKNFLSTGNQPIEIILNKSPTTCITGKNGSGKSSLLDAITFALFGKAFRNINKPLLVNSINNSELLVELMFRTNNKQYLIRRGMKPNIFEIYENDKLVDQQSAVRDYQKYLEETILSGLNEKVFKQVVVIGSADYTPFMKLKLSDRREVIEELLDIKIFSYMQNLAKERITILKDNLKDMDYQVQLNEEKLDFYKKSKQSEQEDRKNKINALKDSIRVELDKLDIIDKSLSQFSIKKSEFETKVIGKDILADSIKNLNTLKNDLTYVQKSALKDATFFKDNSSCPTCKQSIEQDHRRKLFGESKKKLEESKSKIDAIKIDLQKKADHMSKFEDYVKQINDIEKNIYKLETDKKSVMKYVKKIKTEIEDLKSIDASETQDNTKEIKEYLDTLIEKRRSMLEDFEYYTASLSMLKDTGIKSKIIKQYIPLMNKIINDYLIRFGLPIEFTLDETFNEIIRSRYRDSFQYNNFSEGEKQRIDLSLLLAWRQLARSKNTVNTNLLILDEIMDSSLDAGATEELLNILLEMDNKTNIFVISHKSDLTDKLRSHIEFDKRGNFTIMKERPE